MSVSPILALLLGSALATPAADPLSQVLNGPADDAAIYKAHGALKDCLEPTCQAVDHLAKAFRVATRRDLPGTMVRLPGSRHDHEENVGQTLGRLLPANGPLHPAYCPVLTKMARHYDAYSIGLLVVEFANRIDGAGDLCTREVIGAFPRTQEVAGMIQASREACQAARREGCGRDKR